MVGTRERKVPYRWVNPDKGTGVDGAVAMLGGQDDH